MEEHAMSQIIRKKNKTITMQNMCAFLLAIYPVLFSYVSFFNINYGEIMLLVFSCVCVFKSFKLPSGYLLYWIYAAIDIFLICDGFKITYLIPGGISFFIYSLSLAVLSQLFNTHIFYRIFRAVFFVSVIVWCLQFLGLMPDQYSKSLIFPISDHIGYGNVDLKDLQYMRSETDRFCSFFLEPAYYAQFIAIYLSLELFYRAEETKLITKLSLFPICMLLLLRSGLGILCLAVIFGYKLVLYIKNKGFNYYLLLFVPLVFLMGFLFLRSDIGVQMLNRRVEFNEEGTSGFLRLFQGFMIYDEFPLVGKLFGQELSGGYRFANGFTTVLIRQGLIGMILLVYVYFRLYRKSSSMGKCMVWLLLVMSLIEQVYLAPSMLLCTIVAYLSRKNNENSISVPNRALRC